MGTSKAYGGLKGKPTWSKLSRSVTCAVSSKNSTKQSAYARVMSRASEHFRSTASVNSGSVNSGGHAGIKVAQQVGAFIANIQTSGFQSALYHLSEGVNIDDANQAINVIIEKCANNAGILDEVASKAAIKDLLEEIGEEADTIDQFGEKFDKAVEDYGVEELLFMYMGFYMYEHLCTNFYEKLIKQKGITETESFYQELKDYIVERTKTIYKQRDLRNIDWNSQSGKELIEGILQDTLVAFESYES